MSYFLLFPLQIFFLIYLFLFGREATFFLVIDRFNDEASHILSELRSHPKSLFLYLKTAVEVHLHGTLNLSYLRKDDIVNVANCKRVKYQSKGLGAYIERISDFPKFLCSNAVHVTDDMIELYLEVSTFVIHLSPAIFSKCLVSVTPSSLCFQYNLIVYIRKHLISSTQVWRKSEDYKNLYVLVHSLTLLMLSYSVLSLVSWPLFLFR